MAPRKSFQQEKTAIEVIAELEKRTQEILESPERYDLLKRAAEQGIEIPEHWLKAFSEGKSRTKALTRYEFLRQNLMPDQEST